MDSLVCWGGMMAKGRSNFSGRPLENAIKYQSRLIKNTDGSLSAVVCLECKQTKQPDEFAKIKSKYKSKCRICTNKYTREYQRKKSKPLW